MSGMNTAPYQEFAREKLGFEFNNLDLLITALTHRSYVNEHRKSVHEHNERLEFLGDAVLELAVTEYLFTHFSEPEGILTAWRTALVQEISQRVDGQTPVYKVLSEEGPDHDKVFTLGVFVGETLMGRGVGPSKQVAQQQAARQAIARYRAANSE